MTNTIIRRMDISDIDQVLQVEQASFSSPWSRDIFIQELTNNPYAHYFVLVKDDKIIGYVGMWLILGDAQITNIAVLPEYRGRKYGEKLFRHAMEYSICHGIKRLSLEVRVSNIVAQKMYRKFGLVPGGIRKNYYTDNHEDAIVMWVNL